MRRGFRREIDALEEIFRFLEGFVDEAAIDEGAVFTINLVVEELFTNMVRHNTGGVMSSISASSAGAMSFTWS